MKTTLSTAVAAALALSAAGAALATEYGPEQAHHAMPATITKIDHKTGVVDAESMGFGLVVHYPPPAIKDLKVGDKIMIDLGFQQAK
ncbi:MAG: hypothetical protein KGJ55_11490 [Gammaproteobacteria bacterium]|nr:hypothetical protein [Gammaproteobacteria bacterium]